MQAVRGCLSVAGVRWLSSASAAASDSATIASSILNSLKLKHGEALVQNEGDSDISKAIIKLAKERGITTVSIVADKPGNSQIMESLKELGGDVVVPEGYASTWYMKRLVAEVKPKAGLNFSDDSQATAVGKAVAEGGTFLTYGKALPKNVVYRGAIRKPIEWSEFLTKKKLKAQLM
ncbi:uncharacterized protein LOC131068569 [Cryptomeria japonica]|uniref:uncharacterized protein LOC131068569 n=1 Tax=Cryptomeria japonica TaxID=3369 RepID=UPI0027D9EF63|nr:uncharacterized protein LOC131068569 [Cryptomeria japonica]